MSENCECSHELNAVDKIRRKGVSDDKLPKAFELKCSCNQRFIMKTHEAQCPACNMVYGVTPCGAHNINNVVAVGTNY